MYPGAKAGTAEEIPPVGPELIRPSNPPSPGKQAEIHERARALREAGVAELGERAAHLATTDDAPPFGDHEFQVRALAHRIAAKALQPHGTGEKPAPRGPV